MSKRNALRRMLGEATELVESFDLGRQAVDVQKKHNDELIKKLNKLARDGAKHLVRAGFSVLGSEAKLDHKHRPKIWYEVKTDRESGVLGEVQRALGSSAKVMTGHAPGEYSVVVG